LANDTPNEQYEQEEIAAVDDVINRPDKFSFIANAATAKK